MTQKRPLIIFIEGLRDTDISNIGLVKKWSTKSKFCLHYINPWAHLSVLRQEHQTEPPRKLKCQGLGRNIDRAVNMKCDSRSSTDHIGTENRCCCWHMCLWTFSKEYINKMDNLSVFIVFVVKHYKVKWSTTFITLIYWLA